MLLEGDSSHDFNFAGESCEFQFLPVMTLAMLNCCLNLAQESCTLKFPPLLNSYLKSKKLDGILSMREGVVPLFKLCTFLGSREFHPNSNTKG
jgi:hypothetical protein